MVMGLCESVPVAGKIQGKNRVKNRYNKKRKAEASKLNNHDFDWITMIMSYYIIPNSVCIIY